SSRGYGVGIWLSGAPSAHGRIPGAVGGRGARSELFTRKVHNSTKHPFASTPTTNEGTAHPETTPLRRSPRGRIASFCRRPHHPARRGTRRARPHLSIHQEDEPMKGIRWSAVLLGLCVFVSVPGVGSGQGLDGVEERIAAHVAAHETEALALLERLVE